MFARRAPGRTLQHFSAIRGARGDSRLLVVGAQQHLRDDAARHRESFHQCTVEPTCGKAVRREWRISSARGPIVSLLRVAILVRGSAELKQSGWRFLQELSSERWSVQRARSSTIGRTMVNRTAIKVSGLDESSCPITLSIHFERRCDYRGSTKKRTLRLRRALCRGLRVALSENLSLLRIDCLRIKPRT
jgi:hypothetical protein